jgi:diaminohydroxyphosphoribosylaminopyrimidine deaminase/5-amino-6-(5-phosphoribosylamino)uracil reductase
MTPNPRRRIGLPTAPRSSPDRHVSGRLPRTGVSPALNHPCFPPPRGGEYVSPRADNPVDSWRGMPQAFRDSAGSLLSPWEDLFGPLRKGRVDDLVVVGQIGQSLDGRIATAAGRSEFINGSAGLAHLHRLRSLVDAVVVGVATAEADDPQLTVRRVSGPSPARVVIDPRGRLSPGARLLADDGIRRLIVIAQGAESVGHPGVETLSLPMTEGHIAPAAILARLADLGLRRVLIEGGADTLSRFLAAGCVDRLHVVVAPIIIGEGRAAVTLGPIDSIDQALRPPTHIHWLDGEVLFDCDLTALRAPVGRAVTAEDAMQRELPGCASE